MTTWHQSSKKWQRWMYGLVTCMIQGGATAIGAAGGLGAASNLGSIGISINALDVNQMVGIFISAALVKAVAYLKAKPLPELSTDTEFVEKPTNEQKDTNEGS